jgi:hypothetical protein
VFSKINLAIFLTGINDTIYTLAYEGAATQMQIEARTKLTLKTGAGPWFSRSRVYQVISGYLASGHAPPKRNDDATLPNFYWDRRITRKQGKVVPIPNIDAGLAEIPQRIPRLAAQCRTLGIRCLFMTQPTMWRDGLSPAETDLLWFGWVGMQERSRFASVPELEAAMARYNQVLLDTCHQAGAECLDLAARHPQEYRGILRRLPLQSKPRAHRRRGDCTLPSVPRSVCASGRGGGGVAGSPVVAQMTAASPGNGGRKNA